MQNVGHLRHRFVSFICICSPPTHTQMCCNGLTRVHLLCTNCWIVSKSFCFHLLEATKKKGGMNEERGKKDRGFNGFTFFLRYSRLLVESPTWGQTKSDLKRLEYNSNWFVFSLFDVHLKYLCTLQSIRSYRSICLDDASKEMRYCSRLSARLFPLRDHCYTHTRTGRQTDRLSVPTRMGCVYNKKMEKRGELSLHLVHVVLSDLNISLLFRLLPFFFAAQLSIVSDNEEERLGSLLERTPRHYFMTTRTSASDCILPKRRRRRRRSRRKD